MKSIEKIIVVGAGQMGSGIAQVAAQAGLGVVLNDVTSEFTEHGLASITKNLDRSVTKGWLTEAERSGVLLRITLSTSLEDAKDVDLAVEAVAESMDIKTKVFQELDQKAA